MVPCRSVHIPLPVTNGTEDATDHPAIATPIARGVPPPRVRLLACAGHAMLFQEVARFVPLVIVLAAHPRDRSHTQV